MGNYNYWEKALFPQFLSSVDSITLSTMSSFAIQEELSNLVIRAIADFKFPQISLQYEMDNAINPETQIAFGYYFVFAVGQRELNVILARMKQYWVEYQISQEKIFGNMYYDRDIQLYSPGNLLDKLDKLYKTFKDRADRAEYDYGRVGLNGQPVLGDINE